MMNNNFREDRTLVNKNKLILPSAITNYTITTLTKLGHLNRSSEWTQLTDQGLMINQIKIFHYHEVNHINIRSLLMTHHKNQCVINARERLNKSRIACCNPRCVARKIKSLNQT